METTLTKSQLLRAIACILLTFLFAWFAHITAMSQIAKMEAMSSDDYVAYQRHLHDHSYLFAYFSCLAVGGLYLGAVELVAGLFGLVLQKNRASQPPRLNPGGPA